MTKPRTDGFTLIEMLAVIVIIGILLALTMPAVTNLMKSSGLSIASRQVFNTLNLARQYAITHRTNTRVVFPYSGTSGPGLSQAPRYLSYAVITKASTLAGWTYVSKWEFLPIGAVFVQNPAIAGALGTLPNDPNIPFPNDSALPLARLAYIEFTPTGAAANTATLTYREGFMDSAGIIQTPTSANAVTNVIDSLVGRIQVNRP